MKNNPVRVIDLTDIHLSNIVRDVVRSELKNIPVIDQEVADELITRKEAAKILNVSDTTLWRYTKKELIKWKTIGKKIFYSKKSLLSF